MIPREQETLGMKKMLSGVRKSGKETIYLARMCRIRILKILHINFLTLGRVVSISEDIYTV